MKYKNRIRELFPCDSGGQACLLNQAQIVLVMYFLQETKHQLVTEAALARRFSGDSSFILISEFVSDPHKDQKQISGWNEVEIFVADINKKIEDNLRSQTLQPRPVS